MYIMFVRKMNESSPNTKYISTGRDQFPLLKIVLRHESLRSAIMSGVTLTVRRVP